MRTQVRMVKGIVGWILALSMLITACTSTPVIPASSEAPPAVQAASPTVPGATAIPDTATPSLVSPTETPAPSEAPTPVPGLLPEPRAIEFQAEDGQALEGKYYPAASSLAPVVVLMHWAGGDQNDWTEIAHWLQNRGLGGKSSTGSNPPWLDPSWFPPVPEGRSLAVFTFTFRNCEGGCQSFSREGWLLDAQAAMQTASQLEGVDSAKIVALGASIGADGALDGCGWLNAQGSATCLGALSLSPGSYLTIAYDQAVSTLEEQQPPRPAWCLYAAGDPESNPACNSANGVLYQRIEFSSDSHGMLLIQPQLEPKTLELMLDFLQQTLFP